MDSHSRVDDMTCDSLGFGRQTDWCFHRIGAFRLTKFPSVRLDIQHDIFQVGTPYKLGDLHQNTLCDFVSLRLSGEDFHPKRASWPFNLSNVLEKPASRSFS
jgi:hypothetical protein